MRHKWLIGAALLPLAACGGGSDGGSVTGTSGPATSASVTPTPAPAPAPVTVNYDTSEYRRSNGAAQAQALAAYSAGATGRGVMIAMIDSGVDTTSAEFAGRISPLSGDYAGARGIQDEGGHGTAVANVLLAARNDAGIHGVAFDATLLVLRTDTPGSCVPATGAAQCAHDDNALAAALDAAVAARARVVNLSLGGTPANTRLRQAFDHATAAGTIIVIAGGNGTNDNPDVLAQIANQPLARGLIVIAGANDGSGALAGFANRAGNGAANYLTALGVGVRSSDHMGNSFLYSGTSFSAPIVSGAIALLVQAFPNLTPRQIIELLYRTADDRGAPGVDTVYGNGELNLARAFAQGGS